MVVMESMSAAAAAAAAAASWYVNPTAASNVDVNDHFKSSNYFSSSYGKPRLFPFHQKYINNWPVQANANDQKSCLAQKCTVATAPKNGISWRTMMLFQVGILKWWVITPSTPPTTTITTPILSTRCGTRPSPPEATGEAAPPPFIPKRNCRTWTENTMRKNFPFRRRSPIYRNININTTNTNNNINRFLHLRLLPPSRSRATIPLHLRLRLSDHLRQKVRHQLQHRLTSLVHLPQEPPLHHPHPLRYPLLPRFILILPPLPTFTALTPPTISLMLPMSKAKSVPRANRRANRVRPVRERMSTFSGERAFFLTISGVTSVRTNHIGY